MSEPTPGPGADLKAARESLQVSVREVADALNLPARVIEALEADDYERLTPSVFTRGYLRSYARLLELPADTLLARYPEVTEEVEAVTDTRTGNFPAISQPRRLVLPGVGAVIIVLLLVWLLWSGDAEEPAVVPPSPERTEPAAEAALPEPEIRSTATGIDADAEAPDPVLDLPAAATTTPSVIDDDAEVDSPAPARSRETTSAAPDVPAPSAAAAAAADSAVAPEPTVGTTLRERRITEFGDDRLVFRFTEDCWVEVKSLDGTNLYSDLNRAGATLELTGRAPVRVLLGYAPGVSLEFNGEPIVLSRYSRNNVASLVLGQ